MKQIKIQPMNSQAFVPFGELIDFNREPDFSINNGMCDRYHAIAKAEAIGSNAQTIISLGRARPYQLPLKLEMMERHPYGSQSFIPLQPNPFLVIVAKDLNGRPNDPIAFMTTAGQGVNYHRNTWHAVLTPLYKETEFLIVDRDGKEYNLEEFFFAKPFEVCL